MQLESYDCVHCVNITEETLKHLFLDCPFAAMCWHFINVEIPLSSTIPEVFVQIKDQLASPFFMEAIILMAWAIWIIRNDLVFNGVQPSLVACQRVFLKELSLLQHRIKPGLHLQFSSWFQNFS